MEGHGINPLNITPAPSQRAVLRQHVQRWVSHSFYGTMLKQMRNSPFRSEIFDGGRGGQAFSMLLDQQLADRMGRGAGSRLVESIVRRLAGPAEPSARQDQFEPRSERAAD